MRRTRDVLLAVGGVVGVAALVATACGQTAAAPKPTAMAAASTSTPPTVEATVVATVTAVPATPDPRVGAIFLGGQSLHTCTASVLHSSTGDLILTAAHCLAGGVDASFVPAFAESARPQAFWHVDAVYLDPRWVANQNPLADFAVARVSRQDDDGSVEAEAGGGMTIGSSPPKGSDIAVTGYGLGVGGAPVGCTARVALERGYPAIRCAGLVDGTSGSPWFVGATVVGVTGGLEGGGCDENVSYTSPFDGAITALLARAEAGGPPDDAPTAFAGDC